MAYDYKRDFPVFAGRLGTETAPCRRADNMDPGRARDVAQAAFGPLPSARGRANAPLS